MKKAIACILSLVLLVGTGAVFAQATSVDSAEQAVSAQYQPIMPFWSFINMTVTNIGVSGGQVIGNGSIQGIPGVTTRVSIELTIQRRPAGSTAAWTNVVSGIRTVNGVVAGHEIRTPAVAGFEYRTRAVYTAWSGTRSETHTSFSAVRRV